MSRLCPAVVLVAATMLLAAAPADADFGISNFDVTFTASDGSTVTQAGSHPFAMTTSFNVNTREEGGGIFLEEAVKDLEISQIPGFVGNPTAVPPCATADFLTPQVVPGGHTLVPDCANSSVVGLVGIETTQSAVGKPVFTSVFNLEPPPGTAARLGFWSGGIPVTVELGVNEAFPFNITGGPRNISQIVEVAGAQFTLWGVPAAHGHDGLRGTCLEEDGTSRGICEANISEKPFLTLPRACAGPLETTYEADSWPHPGVFDVKGGVLTHDSSGNPIGFSGCGKVGFGPETTAKPSTTSAESSMGLDFEIDVNDEGVKNPDGIAQADIEKIVTALPAGVTANPSAAEGLGVCTKAQYESEHRSTPVIPELAGQGCPDASRLGTIEAESPELENHTLHGSVFLAQQDNPETAEPGAENPFDSLLAFYIIIRDPELGLFFKLPVKVEPNPLTGQLVTSVEELPPFPLSHVDLHLRSGPRAPLVTPPTCGTYTAVSELTPSSGAPPLTTTADFKIDSGINGGPCPAGGVPPFHPGFEAGSINNAASTYSPFYMRLTRGDGEQDLTRFSAVLPPGVSGKIAGVAKCSDQQIAIAKAKTGRQEQASPSCPASSQIGRVLGGAGVGNELTYVPGTLYLAGPFGGDPLSVVAIVPAVAGPFDVGDIVTRVALTLNPETAEVEVDGAHSDPIPHILKGLPLKVRDLRVYTDRPNFTLNATSCREEHAKATAFGSFLDVFSPADDVPVPLSARYQAASCASLGFKPKVALKLAGGTRRNDHPALHSVVTYPYPSGPGYTNIGKAVVTLPPSEFIDQSHINSPCTRVQFNANACPSGSILGTARATTPLLDEPLEGTVYFRSNGGERKLPDVVADLHGLVHIVLVGKVDSKVSARNARIRTTFAQVPDAPVSKFTLDLNGGKKGLLVNNRNLCAHDLRAEVDLTGQSGRAYDTSPVVKTTGCGKAKRHKRRG